MYMSSASYEVGKSMRLLGHVFRSFGRVVDPPLRDLDRKSVV